MTRLPTGDAGRIEALDMLRGFSLLGIFIANMLVFHSPYMYMDPYSWFADNGEGLPFMWVDIFIEASFYPIFAMLFGYGLSMQYEKSLLQKSPFGPVAVRRMSILLLFGLIHGFFIWSGDILFTYAIMGFVMIALVRVPPKWLFFGAIALYAVPNGLITGLLYLAEQFDTGAGLSEFADIQQLQESIEVYGHGSYAAALAFRAKEWVMISGLNLFLTPVMILPLMMIGAAFAKWKIFERAKELKSRLVVVGLSTLIIGLLLKALPFLIGPDPSMQLVQTYFGGPLVAIGYGALVLLLCTTSWFTKVFRPIAKAGRMSMTTYIGQSVIATLIFYHYGFGMYGKVDIMTGTLMAVGIFVVQALLADLWLSRYKMGPIEWVWRIGTYGTILSNKKEKRRDLS
ncbi:DUF418 domain-containing protein [Sporosarcina jeotgali]|uniref:DUF418 domain-containing protein n=1 Tax=Sporosarcina jeotgali TaxID=3020056 RepID=A0ABZ0KXE0_9BACL|nr:DUF418 domain-containing protein [Sporosarcina sp. B2O-1]WOV85056.1 DUF418 domain-containing protein [Sporosarcina sp. B2O-1]